MMSSRRFLLFASTTSTVLFNRPRVTYADNTSPKACGTCHSSIFWKQPIIQFSSAPVATTHLSSASTLHAYIPTPHQTREVVQHTLVDWVEKSTQDYQLLEFAPENLPVHIAFLRLIGVEHVSLGQFSREKGTTQCFLNELSDIHALKHATPLLTHDTAEIFATISEFNTQKCTILSLDTSILNPIDHIRPAIFNISETAFQNHTIDRLYETIGKSTDDELRAFCDLFLINEGPQNKKIIFENLQKARVICANYVDSSFTPESAYPRK